MQVNDVNVEARRLIKHALESYSDVESARDQIVDVADHATNTPSVHASRLQ